MDMEHERRMTEIEERSKSNTHRISELESRQDDLEELVGTVKVLAVREEKVESDVREIKGDVKILTSKSGKRWDDLVNQIIIIVVSTIIGFMLAKIGLQ